MNEILKKQLALADLAPGFCIGRGHFRHAGFAVFYTEEDWPAARPRVAGKDC